MGRRRKSCMRASQFTYCQTVSTNKALPAQASRTNCSRSSGGCCRARSTRLMTSSSSGIEAVSRLLPGSDGIRRFQSFEQPLTGVPPTALQRAQLDAEGLRGLVVGEPQEVLDLHDVAPFGIKCLELGQQFIDDDGQIQLAAHSGQQVIDTQSRELYAGTAARVIDQVTTHGAGGNGEEVAPVLPILMPRADQPHIDLIYQLSGLKGVAFALAAQEVARQTAQLRHHQGEQLIFRFGAAGAPLLEKARDIGALGHAVFRLSSAPWRRNRGCRLAGY